MNLIDLYLEKVGQHLPEKMRADLETEIRSQIEDTLEDRSREEGRAPDETMTAEVLKQFGPPDKMAAAYLPPRYLIGPRLYPTFLLVVQIVLAVVAALAFFGLVVKLSQAGLNTRQAIQLITQSLIGFITSALTSFGNLVFIFAILEWALPKVDEKPREWDPLQLKTHTPANRVSLPGLAVEIVLTAAVLLLFNFYPQLIGIGFMSDDGWAFLPFLTETFFSYLPWFNLIWLGTLLLDVILIRAGTWQTLTRWFKVGLSLVTMAMLFIMITGAPLINLSAEAITRMNLKGGAHLDPTAINTLMNSGMNAVLALILVLEGIDAVKTLLRWTSNRKIPAVTIEK